MNDELTNLTNIPAPTLTLDPVVEDTTVKASVIEVEAPGPFRVEVDGEALSVLEGGGTVLVDAEAHRTSLAGRQLAIDVMSDYPAWEPGPHVVSCPHPFEARWVERWA